MKTPTAADAFAQPAIARSPQRAKTARPHPDNLHDEIRDLFAEIEALSARLGAGEIAPRHERGRISDTAPRNDSGHASS
jgi:hypothetical protein